MQYNAKNRRVDGSAVGIVISFGAQRDLMRDEVKYLKKAGDIAQAKVTLELEARRRIRAEQLEKRLADKIFGTTSVLIVTSVPIPPQMTAEEFEEEYGCFNNEHYRSTYESARKQYLEPGFTQRKQNIEKPMQFGPVNRVVYRGDDRPPWIIFRSGFARIEQKLEKEASGTKCNPKPIKIHGEKTTGGVSTSTDPNISRRKYCDLGGYVYACWLSTGIDTHNFNKLDEIIASYIPPNSVIGVAGPLLRDSCGLEVFKMYVDEIVENPDCNAKASDKIAAMKALRDMCIIRKTDLKTEKIRISTTQHGSYEV